MAFIFIQLTTIILVAGYSIKDAENTKWRLANIGIILGSMFGGIVLAFVIGVIVHDEESGVGLGITLSLIAAFIAAAGAVAGNKWRAGGLRKGHKVRNASNDKTVM